MIDFVNGVLPEHNHNNEELFETLRESEEENKPYIIEDIVKNNLRLVTYIVHKRYSNIGKFCQSLRISEDELYNIGVFALLKAVNTFDLDKGYKFATYASMVISNEYGMNFRSSKKFLKDFSMETPVTTNDLGQNLYLVDILEDSKDFVKDVEMADTFNSIMLRLSRVLNDREKLALKMYYFEDMTYKQISDVIGVSTAYVGRIIKKSIAKARKIHEDMERL